jgi:hypothetical protein
MKVENIDKYCKCMEELKLRIEAVNSILEKRTTTICQATNIEFMCLQIRSILELIALGSLAVEEDEYINRDELIQIEKQKRSQKQRKKYTSSIRSGMRKT